jgi:hypothetical protein
MTSAGEHKCRPRHTLDGLAREFLNSPLGAESGADGSLSRRLAQYLADRKLGRIANDRDAFDMLLNRVLQWRDGADDAATGRTRQTRGERR